IFRLSRPNQSLRVALELELNAKDSARTERMFELLSTSPDFESTFFVADSEKLLDRLRLFLKDIRKKNLKVRAHGRNHGFYFVTLQELLKKRKEAEFRGEDGNFTLSQLENDL